MWWNELDAQARRLQSLEPYVHPSAEVDPSAVLEGPVCVEAGAKICRNAFIQGPAIIGAACLVGNSTIVRGSTTLGRGSRVGFAAEIKNVIIGENVLVGPQCYVADSILEEGVFLGAQVRTSNLRLDRGTVKALVGDRLIDTGLEKLGCFIGANASLGVQTVVLPGRVIAAGSLFEPRVTVAKNLPAGRYRVQQVLESI